MSAIDNQDEKFLLVVSSPKMRQATMRPTAIGEPGGVWDIMDLCNGLIYQTKPNQGRTDQNRSGCSVDRSSYNRNGRMVQMSGLAERQARLGWCCLGISLVSRAIISFLRQRAIHFQLPFLSDGRSDMGVAQERYPCCRRAWRAPIDVREGLTRGGQILRDLHRVIRRLAILALSPRNSTMSCRLIAVLARPGYTLHSM